MSAPVELTTVRWTGAPVDSSSLHAATLRGSGKRGRVCCQRSLSAGGPTVELANLPRRGQLALLRSCAPALLRSCAPALLRSCAPVELASGATPSHSDPQAAPVAATFRAARFLHMVPLRLQLRNFLSYGEAAPPLDFGAFHIACLSGGNGQGKSALLDAITWAIWGEARKSSDARKPDEELLRVGTREMSVDLQLDLDGEVFRVVRSYSQSASGKTSKPGLEFQVQEGEDAWRPLTAESIRATQAVIDERMGIDYETFINSTFLLQGRSDEFTKKKPNERKEILGKILGLDRYDRLAAAASRRWSGLREKASRLEADVERLSEALGPVEEWTASLKDIDADIERLNAELATQTVEDGRLGEQLAAFDALQREAQGHRNALASLEERAGRINRETATLGERIAEADTLVARADAIEADHARYEALHAERGTWDEKATLARGLDQQLHTLRLDLQKQTADLETKVARHESDLRALQERVRDDTRRIDEQSGAERKLESAREAAAELTTLEAVRHTREQATAQIESLDKRLSADEGLLKGKLGGLREQITQTTATLESTPTADANSLRAATERGAQAAAEQERVREDGSKASARVQSLDDALVRLKADEADIQARIGRIQTTDDDTCPTCGTPLTENHREHVAATYADELATLREQRATLRADLEAATARRDALRQRYLDLRPEVEAGKAAEKQLAALTERAAQAEQAEARLKALRDEARQLEVTLQTRAFSSELRARRTELADTLEANPLDSIRYEAVKREASLESHWKEQLRSAQMLKERVEQARADIQRREAELVALRETLSAGSFAQSIRERVAGLEAQVAAVGYDAKAHEAATTALAALSDAPRVLSRLLDARRNRADWAERRAALAEELTQINDETNQRKASLTELAEALKGRDALAERRQLVQTERDAVRTKLSDAQTRRGALAERLERAARDRKALTQVRADLKTTKKDRALYNHLKRAFGRNGIPSLIVEETLPEVEERANALLERLSGGRTRVVLETLKDKKAGGTKETLDIKITDAQGVARAYETFSGGEAFRVNFALRIALSQMLAERSGTRIRTLVIDEGFGTQDKEGLQSLIQAIQAIQDDFDKILVITHLDELKNAFPVRIEVVKRPVEGSTFEIVGV
ncbi:MAG: SMC family ATPase [Rubricoccaceae bacterium]